MSPLLALTSSLLGTVKPAIPAVLRDSVGRQLMLHHHAVGRVSFSDCGDGTPACGSRYLVALSAATPLPLLARNTTPKALCTLILSQLHRRHEDSPQPVG